MLAKLAHELIKREDPDSEIVIAWWTKQWFSDITGRDITDEQWSDIADACDDVLENMGIGEYMEAAAIEILDNEETAQ
jgi:hypothetical protein